MLERRKFIRVDTPVLIEFSDPATGKTQRSFTQDISESGLRFSTETVFQIGQELTLALSLPFYESAMKATGQVVWIREISRLGGLQFEVGIRFLWIEDPDRHRLVRHLEVLLSRSG